MKKILVTSFFVIQFSSFFYAYSSPMEDKPILIAKMEIIEAFGIYEGAKGIKIALIKEDGANDPTSIAIEYVLSKNDYVFKDKVQINNIKHAGCTVEYRAWNNDLKRDIILSDRRNCSPSLKFTLEAEVTHESSYMALAGNPN